MRNLDTDQHLFSILVVGGTQKGVLQELRMGDRVGWKALFILRTFGAMILSSSRRLETMAVDGADIKVVRAEYTKQKKKLEAIRFHYLFSFVKFNRVLRRLRSLWTRLKPLSVRTIPAKT